MPENIKIQYFKTPFGELKLGSFHEQLCLADWRYRKMRTSIDRRIKTGLDAGFVEMDSEVINETKNQLKQYFKGERDRFDVPLLFIGSGFQKNVWNALMEIPYGKTETYLGLSKKLGNEKAIRAVATANGANAISILVPCHRIIGNDGSLVGYAGGLDVKKRLLQLENALDTSQMSLF
ncbi:MAG: methylated-DNA--[protein]-cysteine S-methyltransferase [Chlorobi bacterium]|nr:methylated-DNA--[protein]-cysteine S-methyltransferase [Chlorobiota bacterium]